MPQFLQPLLRLLAVFGIALASVAGEPLLRPHDVIALVGGEDMVAMSEYGYLELLLTCALPDYQLRFRNLAWEGDTVFEQRRDLNFPPLEAQLDKIGATVVIAQFGQMESLAGKEKLPEFVAAYEKLVERLGQGGKRRVALVSPYFVAQDQPQFAPLVARLTPSPLYRKTLDPSPGLETSDYAKGWNDKISNYADAIRQMNGGAVEGVAGVPELGSSRKEEMPRFHFVDERMTIVTDAMVQRDAVHLNDSGAAYQMMDLASRLAGLHPQWDPLTWSPSARTSDPLLPLIQAKNRLWFHYWRPQNWAFLNGDRINQPSSRDHLDPSKRWFPDEIEQFVPLIETKEREIDALAVKPAKP